MYDHFEMSVCFGDYLQTGLRKLCQRLANQTSTKAERLYQEALSLKEGEKRNLRDAFLKFEEASGSGHTEATKELAECYLHGRGCERDLIKAVELGSPEAELELGTRMEKEGKESECMKLFWAASDQGEAEATSKLVEFYREGKIVKKDDEESERLKRLLVTQFQKSSDGMEWRISQEVKTLFIKGSGKMNDYNSITAPWENYKGTIESVIKEEGVESIVRCALSGCKELKGVSIPSCISTIHSNPFTDCPKLARIDAFENNNEHSTLNESYSTKKRLFSCHVHKQRVGI